MAISQNTILAKWQSPKSLLLHFLMNLSETFRIDVNMDFANNIIRGLTKLYPLSFRFVFSGTFLLQCLTWAIMGAWTKNLPKNVGTCPGHHLQLIAQNLVFKIFRGEQAGEMALSFQPEIRTRQATPWFINDCGCFDVRG